MSNLTDRYKSETGKEATYLISGATYHTLRYVNWLEKQIDQPIESVLMKRVKELEEIFAAAKEFEGSDEESSWGEGHVIFRMASDIDRLKGKVREIKDALDTSVCQPICKVSFAECISGVCKIRKALSSPYMRRVRKDADDGKK